MEDLPGGDQFNHMEDLPADALDVYVPDDLVVEEERMVEEEKEAYAEAVSLTLSQDEHTRKSYDSIKNCNKSNALLMSFVNNYNPDIICYSCGKKGHKSRSPMCENYKGNLL